MSPNTTASMFATAGLGARETLATDSKRDAPPESGAFVAPVGLTVDARGYVHPRTEDEICALVRHARAHRLAVRVRGSGRSVPAAIHGDARLGVEGRGGIEVVLDRFTAITIEDATRRVTVQAGCRFGHDPRDETGRSTAESGLLRALEERGLALPNLGGISRTTVVGFLATGAAGGSVRHGLCDSVVALRLVDGTGTVREISRDTDRDLFAGAGVSMGLCGIVLAVTLQCIPRFDLIGRESVVPATEAPFELTGQGPGSLEAFLEETPYARVLWWPQHGVDKLAIWQARPMLPEDYDDETGTAWALRRKPYQAFDPVFGTSLPVQAAAGAALALLGGWKHAVENVAGSFLGGIAARFAQQAGLSRAKSALINAFVPADRNGPKAFWDTWHQGLPMDDGIDERLLPTTFTELWLPLASAGEAMRRLRDLFATDPEAAGSFVVEIYAAGPSPFWMSPSHAGAMLRLNLFWLVVNPEDPRTTHFPKIWDALADLGVRLHWGKLLPFDARSTARDLARRYPRWNDFLRVREALDPDGVFLTSYFRSYLGLEGALETPVAPLPTSRAFDDPSKPKGSWPLLFPMTPGDVSLLDRADRLIDVRRYVPAPIDEVCRTIWFDVSPAWMESFVRVEWVTEPNVAEGAVVDVVFSFMTLRLRTVALDLPGRWRTTVIASSLPLGTSMVEALDLTPAADGGTDVRWRIAYDVHPAMAPLVPLLEPIFSSLFSRSLEGLARYMDRKRKAGSR